MKRQALLLCAAVCWLVAPSAGAQHSRASRIVEDPIPLRNWAVPFEQLRSVELRSVIHPASVPLLPSAPSNFVAIAPCRAVDTRGINAGAFGGPIVSDASYRSWILKDAANCAGIPANVTAYSINLAVFGSAPGTN